MNIKKFLEKHEILIFCISFIFSIIIFSPTCKLYLDNGFDYQALFTWDYNASIGMIPYKDVFYPYGILSFYKDHALLAHVLNIFILPITLTLIYYSLRQLFQYTKVLLLTFFLFFLFISIFTGWEVFNRYGILVGFGLYCTQYFYLQKIVSKVFFLITGIFSGLFFSFATDIGIYLFTIFIILFVVKPLLRIEFHMYIHLTYWYQFFRKLIVYFIGYAIGLTPLIIYLLKNNSIFEFSNSLNYFSDIALYAKIPFLPSLKSIENIFVFSLLFLTVFFVSIKIFNMKKSWSLVTYYEVTLLLIIILLEQKSIIRSIDRTITFVGFLLFCILLYEFFLNNLRRFVFNLYTNLLLIFAFLTGLFLLFGPLKSHMYQPAIKRIYASSNNICLKKNFELLIKENSYKKIVQKLSSISNFNGKIFSFPSDPIFYALLKQKTPYYSNTYDSSSEKAQLRQIHFIKSNNIEYIILNTKIKDIQDSVPEYIRANILLKYILTNFEVIAKMDNFLILRVVPGNQDIFRNSIVSEEYKNYLLNIDLKNIPFSEGIYKYPFSKSASSYDFTNFDYLNQHLKNRSFDMQNSFLAVLFEEDSNNNESAITISRNDGIKSHVKLKRCSMKPCIINLSRLPIFFSVNNQYAYSISALEKPKKIELVNTSQNNLW